MRLTSFKGCFSAFSNFAHTPLYKLFVLGGCEPVAHAKECLGLLVYVAYSHLPLFPVIRNTDSHRDYSTNKMDGEFSFQVQDARRSCGVLQRSIPVPFSTRGPSPAGCLSGTLPSSISHADRQSKSWFASGNSPSKDHLYSRLIPSARGCGDRQNRTEYAVHFQFSDTRQTL